MWENPWLVPQENFKQERGDVLHLCMLCRPQVKCCECGYESNTREGFMDISLEITRASTLTKALQQFTRPEHLDAENKYKCPKEARLVRAVKRISIERAPNVLVIQLKRFEYARHGSKITKKARAHPPWDVLLARERSEADTTL